MARTCSSATQQKSATADAYADGTEAPTAASFTAIPGNPDGVEVSPIDGKIYVNTVSPDLGALDGLDFTDGGTMLNTQIRGGVDVAIAVNCPGRPATSLTVDAELTGPADIALRKMDNGKQHDDPLRRLHARRGGTGWPGRLERCVLAIFGPEHRRRQRRSEGGSAISTPLPVYAPEPSRSMAPWQDLRHPAV